jgi:hypothetical protein
MKLKTDKQNTDKTASSKCGKLDKTYQNTLTATDREVSFVAVIKNNNGTAVSVDADDYRWNPLASVSSDPVLCVSELKKIAEMLYPDDPDTDQFLLAEVRNAFIACAMFLIENYEDELDIGFPEPCKPTLSAVYRLASGDGTWPSLFLRRVASRKFLSVFTRTSFMRMTSNPDATIDLIVAALKEPRTVGLTLQ